MRLTAFLPPLPARSSADVPVFIANPPVVFFTDYEIGSVYEVEILFLAISDSHLLPYFFLKKAFIMKF